MFAHIESACGFRFQLFSSLFFHFSEVTTSSNVLDGCVFNVTDGVPIIVSVDVDS